MFLEFYKLREQPFGVTPDPRYFYLSPTHREAMASLFYGIETGRGFLALIAMPGMGKTTLVNTLQERLRSTTRLIFVSQTQCNSRELLRSLLCRVGVETDGQDLLDMQERMRQFLAREALAGRRFVLVIDEAQSLADSVLETVRLLSNCETPSAKLLQIVLAGQPQLAQKLKSPELEQFRQRIAITSYIEPLDVEEASRYIKHRLQVAGSADGHLFSRRAIENIAELSHGIPRNINNLCFSALSLGYATDSRTIEVDLVKEAAADLGMGASHDRLTPSFTPPKKSAVASSLSILNPTQPHISSNQSAHRQWVAVALVALLLCAGAFLTPAHIRTRIVATAETVPDVLLATVSSTPSGNSSQPLAPKTSSILEKEVPAETSGSALSTSEIVESPIQARATETGSSADARERSPDSAGEVSILVERGDTLGKICRQYLQSDGLKMIEKLLLSNPEIKNPDHVEIGQRIKLPKLPESLQHTPPVTQSE